jgi:hypothetical protein
METYNCSLSKSVNKCYNIYLTHYTHPQKLCKDKIFITDVLNTKQNRVYDKELSLIVKQDDPEGI